MTKVIYLFGKRGVGSGGQRGNEANRAGGQRQRSRVAGRGAAADSQICNVGQGGWSLEPLQG